MTSIASARSRGTIAHSLPGSTKHHPKWWQRRPILNTAFLTDLQRGSYYAAIFTLVESCLQIIFAAFDTYCLFEAAPGSRHFRTFGISFLFVYAGNEYIRHALIICSLILIAIAMYLLVSSIILMKALRKELEVKFKHWLRGMGVFIIVRALTLIFSSIVNDLYFGYHQAMLVLWLFFVMADVFALLVVMSNYQELSNITKLEDMAKLKMSTLSSLNASRSLSRASLDSYRNYGGLNNPPSIRGGGANSTTGSIASFNMYPMAGRVGGNPTGSSIPSSSTFGLNFNPNGIFTTAQLTGSQTLAGGSTGRGSTPSTAAI
ncbi:hypothetical protein HDE_10706 [Halotydeus destructor]|nr:hypothetical protein HDE_10706 [Halotydeus destructor]